MESEIVEEVDAWNPMAEDYDSTSFNSYMRNNADTNPGIATGNDASVDLFVGGIPGCLSEDGLRNLLSSAGHIQHVSLARDNKDFAKHIGFVKVSRRDALSIITTFNNFHIGSSCLNVRMSTRRGAATDNSSVPEYDTGDDKPKSMTKKPMGRGMAWKNLLNDQRLPGVGRGSGCPPGNGRERSSSAATSNVAIGGDANSVAANQSVAECSSCKEPSSASTELPSDSALRPPSTAAVNITSTSLAKLKMPESEPIVELSVPTLAYPSAAKNLDEGQHITVKMLEVVSPSQFWVSNISSGEQQQLDELHEVMRRHYSGLAIKTGFKPNAHKLYAASPTSEFKRWFRVQAINFNTASVTVLYLDYGTVGRVSLTRLHSLEGQFCSLPFQAICCSLANIVGSPHWTHDTVNLVRALVDSETHLHADVHHISGNNVELELILPSGRSLSELLVDCGFASFKSGSSSVTGVANNAKSKAEDCSKNAGDIFTMKDIGRLMLTNSRYNVITLRGASPSDVTVCLREKVPLLQKLMDELNSMEHEAMYLPSIGEVVAVQHVVDNKWYRAETIAIIDNKSVVIRYIDVGNIAVVGIECISKIKHEFQCYPVFGIRVEIAELLSFDWQRYSGILMTLINLEMEIVEKRTDRYIVRLSDAGTGMLVSDMAASTGVHLQNMKPRRLTVGETYAAVVTDATNHDSFHVQVTGIDYLPVEQWLNSVYDSTCGRYSPKFVGEIVTVRLSETWYRAYVCNIDNGRFECLLIDFGTRKWVTVDNIEQTDSRVLAYEAVAFKCSFADVSVGDMQWSADCMRPLGAIYRMKVADIRDDLHIVELVCQKSGIDWQQKLISDGYLKQTVACNFMLG